jgi:chromosomal replication initiation ATPase DnaA
MPAADARQIVLDLPASPPRMTRDSYVVSSSNEGAVRTIEAWIASPERLLVVCGPAGSGKTHLARILAAETGARMIPAARLDAVGPIGGALILDDIDRAANPAGVLALASEALAGGGRLVLVGRGEPRDWAGGLRDLETRLNAATRIDLVEPDEALLKAVILKLFSDRQLRASEAIAAYAAARIGKTFAAADNFVTGLDASSIEAGEGIGIKLARRVIANLSEESSRA